MVDSATIQDLRQELAALKESQRLISEQVELLERTINLLDSRRNANTSGTRPRKSTYANQLTDAMLEILTEERPLHRRDILHRLEGKGIYVGGSNKQGAIGSYLSISPLFKNVAKGTWTLTNEPIDDGSVAEITGCPSSDEDSYRIHTANGSEPDAPSPLP
jgi:hypothetical protein